MLEEGLRKIIREQKIELKLLADIHRGNIECSFCQQIDFITLKIKDSGKKVHLCGKCLNELLKKFAEVGLDTFMSTTEYKGIIFFRPSEAVLKIIEALRNAPKEGYFPEQVAKIIEWPEWGVRGNLISLEKRGEVKSINFGKEWKYYLKDIQQIAE